MAPSGRRSLASAFLLLFSWERASASTNVTDEPSTETTEPPTLCDMLLSVEIPKAVLISNGSLWDPDENIMYPPGRYWNWEGEGEDKKPVYRGCPCNLEGRSCIWKCCPMGESMSKGLKCVPNEYPINLNVTEDGEYFFRVDGTIHFALLFGNPCPQRRFLLDPFEFESDRFYVRSSDGFLVLPRENAEKSPKDFCIDYFPEKHAYLPLVCLLPIEDKERNTDQLRYKMYPVGMLVSIPFLLVTFLVYALIPELRNLHGKSLMCHVSSLSTAYTFLVAVQLGGYKFPAWACVSSAFIIEFSLLATFFWLNIMCFDIYLTFSTLRHHRIPLEKERKKFLIYSLYAWGCPLIILIVSIIMDYAPGISDEYLKPRFGELKCWFENNMNAFAYFFGPVAVLVACNVILFIITAVKIISLKRATSMLKKGDSRMSDHNEDRNRFNLYLKLLIVMGVNWVMELISWAIGGPGYLWYVTDIGNTLQGFFIFLIFVWKDKIRNILLQKLCPALAARRSVDGSSWYKWRSHRATCWTESSTIGCTMSTNYSTTLNSETVKLKPQLNSPLTSPNPVV